MHESLQNQLALAEETFLSAVSEGPAAIEAFMRSWSTLEKTVNGLIDLDEETVAHAHNVAARIEIIADFFIQLHQETSAVTLSLQNDLDAIFADLNIGDPLHQTDDDSRSKTRGIMILPYIEPAYTWLLDNLHNPYPSKKIKAAFAYQTNLSLKDIDNWFINVRRRIGWNKLRMKHFKNKRSEIIDAATRFFKELSRTLHHDPCITSISGIDLTANHDSEFKAIETRARELYSDKLFETPLATKIDGAVDDLTHETKARVQAQEEYRRQVAKSMRGNGSQCLSAYPSPECSPERSPEPSAPPLPTPDATPATGRKRRNCDRDSPELDVEGCDEVQKRSRLDSYQISCDLAIASLPSPAASLSNIPLENFVTLSDQAQSENGCIVLPVPPIPVVSSGKRKRRLSDAANDGPSKRPHNALAVPRLQTVSDPLPLANPIISELYRTVFGQAISDSIPGPVSVESLDDTQVEVDFYNYNALPDTIQPILLANSSSNPCPTGSSVSPAANSGSPSLDKFQGPDPSFDFLFETYLKDLDIPQASTDISFFPDIPSHDHSALFPFENMLPTQPPQDDVISDPLSYFQLPSPPWNFQGNGDSFSSISPSPGTLFSSNRVPQINPTQNEKETKLKQIEALRAELQNLEAEL